MNVPAWTRMSANSPKVDVGDGGVEELGDFFLCVSGLTLIMALLISVSQRGLAWKDAT